MNGYDVYNSITKPKNKSDHEAEDLYLKLLRNPCKNVDNILFNKSRDEHNKEIYLQTKTLFDLREQVNKEIIRSDFDQSGIDDYEKSIAERTKLRRQRFDEIKEKEQNINSDLFKEYFKYQSPSNMFKELDETKNTETNKIKVDSIKKTLSKLQKTIDYVQKENTFKIEENKKIIDIVKRILKFNQQNQQGEGLKILTSNQMLSRLPIALAQLNAGNNSEKLKNEIRQLLYSLYRSKKLTKQMYKSLIDII